MKSRLAIPVIAVLSAVVFLQIDDVFDDGPSFREQIVQLVVLRDSGSISQDEYKSLKRHVLNAMMH